MNSYTTKWLPVEGEIKPGSYVPIFKGDKFFSFYILESEEKLQMFLNLPGSKERGVKLAKLFLISFDIQVGDKYYYSDTEIDICDSEIRLEQIKEQEERHGVKRFKVIGEISPDALSYVKEGKKLKEEHLRFQIINLIHDRKAGAIYTELEFPQKLKKQAPTLFEIMVKVLGPCGHFH